MMTAEVMEIDRLEILDIGAEAAELEHGKYAFWETLKQNIDDELNTEDMLRVLYLLKDKFEGMFPEGEFQHPSDLLSILENNMLMEDALSTVQHVFSVMDHYPEYGEKSFGQIVTDHMSVKKQFGCFNIIGREKEINSVFKFLNNPGSKGIWIYGAGGLGKTLLANEVCLRLFSENVAIINVDLKHVKSSDEFVRSILFEFAVHPSHSDLTNLISELLYQLKSISQDTCILLDNIEDVYNSNTKEVLDILHRFWDSPMPVRWLMTSREPIKGDKKLKIKLLELQPLRRESAEKLLKQSCKPVELTDQQCQILLNMAGEVPLAIRLLSSALKSHRSDSFFHNQLLELLTPQLHHKAMQDCIQYSYNSLTEHEKYQLHMLSVVETSQFDIETVKAILEGEEKEAVFLMMKLTNRQIVQRVSSGQIGEFQQMSSSGLQYCIHPLIFDYVRNLPMPQEYTIQAQSNFCKHMIQKMEPFISNCNANYKEAIGEVSSNQPLLKVMFNVLSMHHSGIIDLFASDRNIYLSRLQEMLQITQSQKEQLYTNLIEQMKSNDRKQARFFWEIEKLRMLVDCKRFTDAEVEVKSLLKEGLLEIADSEFNVYLKGRFWYNRGRLLRFKKEKQLNEALECFQYSLKLYQNTQYIPDATMALNAIGNTYFDQGDYDNALSCHNEAADRLRNFVSDTVHPEVAVYEFNAGTVFLAKARQDLSIYSCVTKEANQNFQKALDAFQNSMAQDVQLGTNRMQPYASKLSQRAQALFHLNRREDAIADIRKSLEIKLVYFEAPDQNRTMAYFNCGKTFLDWRNRLQQGPDEAKSLLKEATVCFRHAEVEMRSHGSASLTGTDKSDFIRLYMKIAENVKRRESKLIREFCERYENGVTFDSSSSSSSPFSSQESSPSGQMYSNSDEGIDIDDDVNENEANTNAGIPSVHTQKQQATRFEQQLFADINSQLSTEQTESKKRQRSSSESDG